MNDFKQNDWKKGAFILLVIGAYFIFQIVTTLKHDTEPGAALREVESLESLEHLWHSQYRVDDFSYASCGEVPRRETYMQLDTMHNQLILPVWESKIPLFERLYLTGFDLETGQTNWSTLINKDYRSHSIKGNSTHIIVVERGPEPPLAACSPDLHYCESAKILAYDIGTGEEVWSKLQSNMNRAGTLCVGDEIVSIEGLATRSNYREKVSLDVLTGDKIPFQDLYPDTTNLDLESNRRKFNNRISHIIEEMGFDGFYGDYVNQGNYLYFLTRYNKTLWVINRETSEAVGKAEFSGEPFVEGSYYQFAISAVNDYVVVYLGDSQQVFTFRLLQN